MNKDTAALIANSVAVVPSAIAATEQTITKTTTITTSKTVKTNSGEHVLSEKQQQQSHSVSKSAAAATRAAATREANQNESNLLLEQNAKLKTSTPRASHKEANNSFNNSSNITNGVNLEDHVAFKEYKEAGEYWNKFPKTDYTYSKLSQQRREIKPGVIAMPNMSRRSLEHHQERVNQMIRQDPAQESFFRSRYEALTTLRKRYAADSYYDSQDETDIALGLNGSRSFSVDSRSFFRRLITVITSFFSSTYYRVTSVFRREQQPTTIYYTTRFGESKKGTHNCKSKTLRAISIHFLCTFNALEIKKNIDFNARFILFLFKRYRSTIMGERFQCVPIRVCLHLFGHFNGSIPRFMGTTIIVCIERQKEGFPNWLVDLVAIAPYWR